MTYALPQLTDAEWRAISAQIPRRKTGRPPRDDRAICSAICYAEAANCAFEILPEGYPAASTVRVRAQRWRAEGVLDRILEAGAPAIARMHADFHGRLRELSHRPRVRTADDPEWKHLPRFHWVARVAHR